MKMKLFLLTLVLSLAPTASATDGSTCVILKRSTDAVHTWIGIEFYYVEGSYPPGFNFMTNLRGRHVRKLIKMGGRMAIVEPDYTAADLESARKQCATSPATPRQPDAPKQ